MRHLKTALFTLLLLLALTGQGMAGILPEAFWQWGGETLLAQLQGKINGQVRAREMSGNPLTGLTYRDLEVRGPGGEVVLTAPRLEVRLSLWSLASLRLEVAHLALDDPHLYLVQDQSRHWNVSDLKKEEAAAPQGKSKGFLGYLLKELDFSRLEVARGQISVTRQGVTTQYTDLHLKGQLVIRQIGSPERDLSAKLDEFAVNSPQGRVQLATNFTYRAQELTLESLHLKVGGGTVLSFLGKLCQPFSNLSCDLTGEVGPLPGKQLHEWWPKWPAAWDISGKLQVKSGAEGLFLQGEGKLGQANFSLSGRYQGGAEPPVFELDLDLKGLTPAQLQEIQGLKKPELEKLTPLDLRLHVQGAGPPWNPASLEARLDLNPFQWREVKVQQAQLTLRGDARRQELHAYCKGNFGALTVDSQGRLLPLGAADQGPAGELSFATEAFQPSILGVKQLPGTSLNSNFKGNFRLPPNYSLAQGYLAGTLAARGRLGQEPLNDFKSTFVLEGKKLTLTQADIKLAGLEAHLKGHLSEGGPDLTFTCAVAGSRHLPGAPPVPSFGHLKGEGTLKGTWQAPQWTLAAKVNQLEYSGVSLATADLNATFSGWPPNSGRVYLQGSQARTAAGVLARVNLTAQGEAGRWQFRLAGASQPAPVVELAGALDASSRPLTLSVDRFSWQGQKLTVKNQAPFQVRLLPGWEISSATFKADGGAVTVQAVARGQELSGRLDLKDLDASALQPLGLQAQGKVSGYLTLAGTPAAPSLEGRLELASGKIQDVTLKTLVTTLSYRDQQLQLNGFLEEPTQGSRLAWKGTVPVHLSFLPPRFTLGDQGLDLRVKSEKVNLSILQTLSPDIQSINAPVDMEVLVKGNPRQPQVTGHVHWGEGTVQVRPAGIPYRLEPGELRLQGSKILVPGIVIRSDGTIRLSGEILLTGEPRAELKAQLDNFRVLDRGGNEIWTGGSVDLGGPLHALVAKGRLAVPRGQFRPGFFRSEMEPDIILVNPKPQPREVAAPDIYRNMRVEVTLDSPGNVWLKDPKGQVEMAGTVKAIKKPGQKLAFGGQIRALKGTLEVEQRTFKVEHAVLNLPGVPGQPGIVDGKATHQMEDITLVLTVTGPVSGAQIRMESLPPLPPADVLSYLAFGAPAATLSRDQYLALGQSLGVLGGITPLKMEEILGTTIPLLSGIKVKSGMVGGRPTVGVAKEITKNVSVFYGRNLNEERGQYERQVGIEYKINKNFSIESQLGPRNSGADVLFNYDF